jgi:chemotaxis protein CheD
MKVIKNVDTGKIDVGNAQHVLIANSIGSCIAVALFDFHKRIGGLAHVMLPGKAPENSGTEKFRYAEDAIKELIKGLKDRGGRKVNMKACIAGGGNVLKRTDDVICQANIDAVMNILKKQRIFIVSSSVGGQVRRSLKFDIETGKVYCSEGDESRQLICKFI